MKKYYHIFIFSFILIGIIIFLLLKRNHQIPKNVRSQLITKSLVEQIKFLPRTSYPYKTSGSKNIFIYNSGIIKNSLPKLTHTNFIFLNSSAIKDSVNRIGSLNYLELSLIYQESDGLVINWDVKSGIYSHNLKKIIYQTNENSRFVSPH